MKSITIPLALSLVAIVHAGHPIPLPLEAVQTADPWITPTLDMRVRYELGDVDGSDVSHAFTLRERLGLKTTDWHGWSAFVEGEFSQAAIDDYNGGAPLADPAVAGNAVIADPETNELNQLYVQYAGYDNLAKVGRQRIIYGNAAFIGNVGWRQNEQTFDAVSLTNTCIDDLTLDLAYINQVNRIFGSDAGGTLENLPGDIFIANASYSGIQDLVLGVHAYSMDFEDSPGLENNTFGVSAKGSVSGFDLYGEMAWQDKAGGTADGEAWYVHTNASRNFSDQTLTLGVEHLDAGFKTPLATLHAFNGFADAFIGGRAGGTHNGLTNVYLAHTLPVCWGMKWTNTLHALGDNEFSAGYGWEFDSVLAKKFSDQLTGIAKLAHFESEGDAYIGATEAVGTTRFSVELNYNF